jgi:hypothetical protein
MHAFSGIVSSVTLPQDGHFNSLTVITAALIQWSIVQSARYGRSINAKRHSHPERDSASAWRTALNEGTAIGPHHVFTSCRPSFKKPSQDRSGVENPVRCTSAAAE